MYKYLLSLLVFFYVIFSTFEVGCGIYYHKNKDGSVSFTDTPWRYNKVPLRLVLRNKKQSKNITGVDYDSIIANASRLYAIEGVLIKALIKVESGFRAGVVSNRGAIGLMQIMPHIVKMYDVSNAFDPVENIQAGTKYLSMLLRMFNGNRLKALAAYNLGPARVQRLKKHFPYKKTAAYLKKIVRYYHKYKGRDESFSYSEVKLLKN